MLLGSILTPYSIVLCTYRFCGLYILFHIPMYSLRLAPQCFTFTSYITRNTHAHLCPRASAQTMRVRHICMCRWGARGTCYVCCRRSCLVFVVSKPMTCWMSYILCWYSLPLRMHARGVLAYTDNLFNFPSALRLMLQQCEKLCSQVYHSQDLRVWNVIFWVLSLISMSLDLFLLYFVV